MHALAHSSPKMHFVMLLHTRLVNGSAYKCTGFMSAHASLLKMHSKMLPNTSQNCARLKSPISLCTRLCLSYALFCFCKYSARLLFLNGYLDSSISLKLYALNLHRLHAHVLLQTSRYCIK